MKQLLILPAIAFVCCNLSCTSNEPSHDEVPETTGTIEVITNTMDFVCPDTVLAGWNTFRYVNKSNDVHFFVLEKLPDGITIDHYRNELLPPFRKAFELMHEGKMEAGMAEFSNVPEWFGSVVNSGGVGLLSAQATAATTFKLEPGNYAMECYVRMSNGLPHVMYGMLKGLHVAKDTSSITVPQADIHISIDTAQGIVLHDSVSKGTHVFAVRFLNNKMYESFSGHDVHLVRAEIQADLDELVTWINAADIKALGTPYPKGFQFMGGTQEMPAGNTAFFSADLLPGRYLLIAEIPDAANRNMLVQFTVH